MRGTTVGAALVTALLVGGGVLAWRLANGVESWLVSSGAGNTLGWAFIAWLILAGAALPAWAWGMAARAWVVRMRQGEYLAAQHRVLLGKWEEDDCGTRD